MSMLEKAAAAARDAVIDAASPTEWTDEAGADPRDFGIDAYVDLHVVVRAVLAAIREPSEEVANAAHAADQEYTERNFGGGRPIMHQPPEEHWPIMIDAILEGK